MKKGQILSLQELELRTLSKRANQRLLELERYMKRTESSYHPAVELAHFLLEGRKRFQEDPTRLSEDQKQEQLFAVTAFLNEPQSTITGTKQAARLRLEIDR